jgi:hypothetical protein
VPKSVGGEGVGLAGRNRTYAIDVRSVVPEVHRASENTMGEMVPTTGLAPVRPFGHQALNLARLLFHHEGMTDWRR